MPVSRKIPSLHPSTKHFIKAHTIIPTALDESEFASGAGGQSLRLQIYR